MSNTEDKPGSTKALQDLQKYSMRFPVKLWSIIDSDPTGSIGWTPDGSGVVIDHQRFEAMYLKKMIFKTTKISSFVRQLNLYGFRKVKKNHLLPATWESYTGTPYTKARATSADPNGKTVPPPGILREYRHRYFTKGRPDMVHLVRRSSLVLTSPKRARRGRRKRPVLQQIDLTTSAGLVVSSASSSTGRKNGTAVQAQSNGSLRPRSLVKSEPAPNVNLADLIGSAAVQFSPTPPKVNPPSSSLNYSAYAGIGTIPPSTWSSVVQQSANNSITAGTTPFGNNPVRSMIPWSPSHSSTYFPYYEDMVTGFQPAASGLIGRFSQPRQIQFDPSTLQLAPTRIICQQSWNQPGSYPAPGPSIFSDPYGIVGGNSVPPVPGYQAYPGFSAMMRPTPTVYATTETLTSHGLNTYFSL